MTPCTRPGCQSGDTRHGEEAHEVRIPSMRECAECGNSGKAYRFSGGPTAFVEDGVPCPTCRKVVSVEDAEISAAVRLFREGKLDKCPCCDRIVSEEGTCRR